MLFFLFLYTSVPGKLKQFTADLHSGKLHQDFHNPPPDAAAQGHHHGEPPKQVESTQVYKVYIFLKFCVIFISID